MSAFAGSAGIHYRRREGLKCAEERTRSRGMGARVAVGAFFDEVMRGSA